MANVARERSSQGQNVALTESSMETLFGRRANKANGLTLFPAPNYRQVRRVFGGLVRTIYRIEVIGADHLPVSGPAVVASNHESFLDAIILGAAISRDLRFVAKAELWRFRLLAWILDGLGAIPVERSHSDFLALAKVLQALDEGEAVAVFPQGGVYGNRAWRRGAAHVALVTGAPLVPVHLIGTARALARGKLGFPKLRVIVGEPIEAAWDPEDRTAATKLTERLRIAVESLV
jgi:1-acyl-sn-glycerol-3-phosphate acyltransferase